ncbi:MAG: 3-deoxy-D-manno-octulosonic acid transferase [Deltaproteobacteria bacterium]|nr:3-deoxy-D-manno-octulosonic acid transferase [Deltaproteobacteria bacterium]
MEKALFFFYNIFLLCLFPLFFVALILFSLTKNKKSQGFFYKLFPFAYHGFKNNARENGIWIHAVSLGEIRASVNFIELIRGNSERKIILSSTTKTGYDFAKNLYKNKDDILIFYFPYDFYFSVKSILRHITPALFISIETEIWPNLFNMLNKKNIPIAVINARISDKSYKNYLNFSFFFKHVFKKIDTVLCISENYRKKFASLGVYPENIHITGNMKFDLNVELISGGIKEKSDKLKRIFSCGKIIAAGSTHEGEENMILNIAILLSKSFKEDRIFLFIAPRHPERFEEVYNFVAKTGIKIYRLSSVYSADFNSDYCKPSEPETIVILVDIIGELLTVYSICDAAFVGGSMVNSGGHNLLEPLIFGKPVIFGKYVQNFLEIAEEITETKSGLSVNSSDELYDALASYLYDVKASAIAGKNGLELISRNKGSSQLNFSYLSGYLTRE